MNKFAENLRARRTALGLTQEALAEKLHVTRQAVSNWENGKNQPDLEMLALLSWALEADVSALLGGDAPPRSRGNLRRAVWFALALLGAALACRLPLPYLAEWYQRTYIMWPYQLYLLLLRPLLWALGAGRSSPRSTPFPASRPWPGGPGASCSGAALRGAWCGSSSPCWGLCCPPSPCTSPWSGFSAPPGFTCLGPSPWPWGR